MATEQQRAAWKAAQATLSVIEKERAELLAPTQARYEAAQNALLDAEYAAGGLACTCESCGEPVFEGEPMLGGETPLCGACAPTYADLLDAGELSGFVQPADDGDWDPMTAERARELYDAHIAAGGAPTDSMARA